LKHGVLGRTGYKVSTLTIGGCGPGIATSTEEAIGAFEHAVKNGVNMVDIAPSYGNAEVRLGPLISRHRDELILSEKTLKRNKEDALAELQQSLRRLGTKHFDIYQFHAVDTVKELDQIFHKNGAMEAFLEAKNQNLIRHIGITAHRDMRVVLKALERFDFDTVLIPINAGSLIYPAPENDFRPVLKAATARDIEVIAIKAIARGRWTTSSRRYQTWYEPLDKQEDIDRALWFTLSQEGVATCPLACDVRLWPKIISAAKRFKRLDEHEQKQALEYLKNKGVKPLFPEGS